MMLLWPEQLKYTKLNLQKNPCNSINVLTQSVLQPVEYLLQTHINFPRFLPIFPDFLERLSH